MPADRARRRLTAWIAMFAILLGALAPTVSHAIARASGQDARWIEVCTVAGIRMMLADAQDASADPAQDGSGTLFAEGCPYCGTHAGAFGLPPTSVSGVFVPDEAVAHVVPPRLAPRPLIARTASQPRAPPISA